MAESNEDASSAGIRLVVLVAAGALVVGLTAFVLSRFPPTWPLAGIYIRVAAVTVVVNVACIVLLNPKLIARRAFPGPGTKPWDVVILALLVPSMIGVYIVAGYDGRPWASDAPDPGWLVGLAVHVAGWGLITWSMVVNPFFEKTVRIQSDHTHRVIDRGPYALVRHPGYVGFSLWLLSVPLLFGSAWAFVPAVLGIAVFVVRTALEDRALQIELDGYAEYATRTRFRLIPGVW